MLDALSNKFYDAFQGIRGKSKISESNIEDTIKEVRTALLEADVNFKVVREFVNNIKEKSMGEKVLRGVNPGEQFVKIVYDELSAIMGDKNEEIDFDKSSPMSILVVGLNGSGKTTFSGKLGRYLTEKRKKDVLLVPADTFRPAAKDQLLTLAKQVGVDYFDSDLSKHPRDIAKEAFEHAKEIGKNIVIIDTAGRLHVDEELMDQIEEVRNILTDPEVLLVADAMTGQEAINVAKVFHERVKLTGVVLSKMDSDARGGAALSIRHVTQVPIRFISTGEKMEDLELFHPDRLASRILDMGDVLSLVEKAEESIDKADAENMMKRMEKGEFSVDDFMKQMNMIKKLGSFSSLMKMIPGMGGMMRQIGDLSPAEDEMGKMKVIIQSMTKQERDNYTIIQDSRITRIAKGSGSSEGQVRDFIGKFRQMKDMMGGMMGLMKGGMMPGMGGMPGMEGMAGMDGMPAMPGRKGFRQSAGKSGKTKNKGKKSSPFGKKYF